MAVARDEEVNGHGFDVAVDQRCEVALEECELRVAVGDGCGADDDLDALGLVFAVKLLRPVSVERTLEREGGSATTGLGGKVEVELAVALASVLDGIVELTLN